MRIGVRKNALELPSGLHRFAGALLRSGTLAAFATCVGVSAGWPAPRLENGKALQVYFVDVEGGQATLFVTPEGKSLLIDTGWPDNNGRDADRILAAARLAGIKQIDFVLLTHYHMDHAGGITQLAAEIPIRTVIDHGENREPNNDATVQMWESYQKLVAKEKLTRIIAKPGDTLPLEGIEA